MFAPGEMSARGDAVNAALCDSFRITKRNRRRVNFSLTPTAATSAVLSVAGAAGGWAGAVAGLVFDGHFLECLQRFLLHGCVPVRQQERRRRAHAGTNQPQVRSRVEQTRIPTLPTGQHALDLLAQVRALGRFGNRAHHGRLLSRSSWQLQSLHHTASVRETVGPPRRYQSIRRVTSITAASATNSTIAPSKSA